MMTNNVSLSQFVLESLSEQKKKKLKKLALAGGIAALGGAAGLKHLANRRAEKKDFRASMAGGAVLGGMGAGKTGSLEGGVGGLMAHGINRGIAHGVTRLVHGKDTFFNRGKKANLRRKIGLGLDAVSAAQVGLAD